MSILINGGTRVIVQGITGRESSFWTQRMLEAGTSIVAGVTPGKEGANVYGVPVYDTVKEALRAHPAEVSVMFVPPPYVKDGAHEAIEAGLELVVILADGVPVHDVLQVKEVAARAGSRILGPNTPGLATIGAAMLGFIPVWLPDVYRPGKVGVVSRSGTLTNEISAHLVASGYGISTVVGCGGDPVPGMRFGEVLELFRHDAQTEAVVMVGELGGAMEEEAAEYIRETDYPKPVVAYIAGRTAPAGKRMGHAGAIVAMGKGTVAAKQAALQAAGVYVAEKPADVRNLIQEALVPSFSDLYGESKSPLQR